MRNETELANRDEWVSSNFTDEACGALGRSPAQRDTAHLSLGRSVIIRGVVRGGPVVPHDHVAGLPTMAQRELRLRHVRVEQSQEVLALNSTQSGNVRREARIDKQ